MIYLKIVVLLSTLFHISCGISNNKNNSEHITYKYLALGDSYTIGESVCESCNFPQQLTDSLNNVLKEKTSVKIIAKTGWTTSDLIPAIAFENTSKYYNLVTILVGVNNQYQEKPFSLYEKEFPELLDTAIDFAKGIPENVIVLSIPDYAFTPFGRKSGKTEKITEELIKYNDFAEKTASEKGVHFVSITSITQQRLENPELVASDGLHPSELAYKMFVGKILPLAKTVLKKQVRN